MTNKKVEIINSKLNLPIIQVEHEGHMLPIHSKYNPIAEAERLIDSYAEQIEQSDHIFFYGVGLGYHVKVVQQRYPEKLISIYEPIVNVYTEFTQNAEKIGVDIKNIANQYVEYTKDDIVKNLNQFKAYLAQSIVILVHPVYEKIAQGQFQQFSSLFQQFIQDTRSNKQTHIAFNDRWVINTIMNAKWTFNTPNILNQKNNLFEGKPIVLVAAGPSLSEEMDNLRYIKEHGLAFIFAVGSANEALLDKDIYPDAVLSYDPSIINYQVFMELAKRNITDIPLIFGTTVGHETVSMFPGPKMHMVMHRDSITPYLHGEVFETVNDAATISNVTIQLLNKLKVSKVILVGQNFAYKNDLFYAKGIQRYDKKEYIDGVLQKIESDEVMYVEDVHGRQVQTELVYDQMRREMEIYIRNMKDLKVVNATQGGAKIEGAVFQSLKEIIDTELFEQVVPVKWWEQLEQSTKRINNLVISKLEKASLEYMSLFNDMIELLERLEKKHDSNNSKLLNRMLDKMYKLLNQLTKNTLFDLIIEPIISVHTERFYSNIKLCQRIADTSEKIKMVSKIYREYMLVTLEIYRKINPILQLHIISKMKSIEEWKYYEATYGVFHFEGNWHKKWLMRQEQNGELGIYGASAETRQQGAAFDFKFTGTAFQLMGTNSAKGVLKLKITIDQKEKIVPIYENINEGEFSSFHQQVLFEASNLLAGMHEVTVEILSNEVHFNLLGIRISKDGRGYHIHEVEKIEDLAVGKRIRCHYEASYNVIGEFNGLGEEKGEPLPIHAVSNPNGDFYFIMVDDAEGEKTLIADRIIQNRVSKNAIKNREILFGEIKGFVSLLTSSVDLEKSEWDQYLVLQPDVKCNNLDWNADSFSASWVNDMDFEDCDDALMRGSYIGEDGTINMDEGFAYSINSQASNTLKMNGYRPKFVIFKE